MDLGRAAPNPFLHCYMFQKVADRVGNMVVPLAGVDNPKAVFVGWEILNDSRMDRLLVKIGLGFGRLGTGGYLRIRSVNSDRDRTLAADSLVRFDRTGWDNRTRIGLPFGS